MVEIWESVINCINEVNREFQIDQLDNIGITNQRETTLVWDPKTGECPTKAIVWQDRRTSDFCKRLKNQSLEEMIKNKTGLILDPYLIFFLLHQLLQI